MFCTLPDPWLLLAKSAINYTASNGQNVMSACVPHEESDVQNDYEHPRSTRLKYENIEVEMDDFGAGL